MEHMKYNNFTHNASGLGRKRIQGFRGKLRGRNRLEDLGVDGS